MEFEKTRAETFQREIKMKEKKKRKEREKKRRDGGGWVHST